MAAEVSADLNVIHDEDVLRRMWQQTDDFGRKKEIRQRMYKLREQRLRDFYTGDSTDMTSRKHTGNTYTDSIADQGFMSLKSKEIRDSESPTRDIHKRQGDNSYWNTVQQSSCSDEGGVKSYERSSTGTGLSADGNTQLKLEADERGFATSKTSETENAKTVTDKEQHDAQISTASHTKTDSGEAYSYSTSQEHEENSSSVTEAKDSTSAYKSSKWETSSVTSSSSCKVASSSNYGRLTSKTDYKALMSEDNVDLLNSFDRDEDFNTSTIRRIRNSSNARDYKTHKKNEEHNFDNRSDSRTFIDTETRNNIRNNLQDINVNIVEDHFTERDSRRDSTSTCKSEFTSNVDNYVTQKDASSKRSVIVEKSNIERNNTVVDQNIMTEINKLDSFLSTQNTGTNTPASPRSIIGEINWTVVSNNDGEFVYRDDKDVGSPGARVTPIKQPDNLDLPKECTEGQYMTTYNEHYTSKRISVDVSPTHDKFARSLRQTPPGTPRSLSRQSLDRSSPERKPKNSPRSSPDKERRTSTGSYTVERPGNSRRKSSEVTRQTAGSKESTLKTKRKFSTTQNKAATKVRTSTPGTSPSTSPSRKQREMSESASSASDSDASQVTYDKKSTSSIHKRADVVRRNLMNEFDKESSPNDKKVPETGTKNPSRSSSPQKSPTRKISNTNDNKSTGILRKGSITDSKTTISSITEHKMPSQLAPHVRETSPEYSSEGSIGKEIKHSQRQTSPDSSPERAAFTPIKQFRTSPEQSTETIQVTASETDHTCINQSSMVFINQEIADTIKHKETVNIDIGMTDKYPKYEDTSSPSLNKTPQERKSSPTQKQSKRLSTSPETETSPSSISETTVTRKNSYTRKESTFRGKSPQKEETPRAKSPTKGQTPRKPSFSNRSMSPQKEQQRSVSPTKVSRKPSIPERTTSPTKTVSKSRSPSPTKKESVSSTTVITTTRKSSLKKESSFKEVPTSRNSSNRETSPFAKGVQKSRSPSPKKESPDRRRSPSVQEYIKTRSPSPTKASPGRKPSPTSTKSPSPQRASVKRTHHQLSSPSVSPCSSPERTTDRKSDKPRTICKINGHKSPDKDTVRTTRRSSIPRSEQSTVVRKTVETKIEIQAKPTTKIPSSTSSRPKQSQTITVKRPHLQNAPDRKEVTKTFSTTIRKTVERPKDPLKKATPTSKKIVTTTAVISLQKPTVLSQVRQSTTSTVSKTSTYKRTPSKEIAPKKTETPTNKKLMVTTTTKRIASRTNTPKSKGIHNNDETDRSSIVSSPGLSTPSKVTSEAFIEHLKQDESAVHGYKNETINLEITDLENETRPELYPETEEDDDNFEKQDINSTEETSQLHKTEKTIQVDSKRKVASQIMVTIKKPTATTVVKPSTKPVTSRSSSGPVKSSPQTPSRTTTKSTSNKQIINTVQKSDSLNMIRTPSDKNISKSTPQKRQMSKPEMATQKPTQSTSKVATTKQITETGIASRNVTTAKSATLKRVASAKKKSVDTQSSSSSEDEADNIPSVVTPNRQEQEYIEELEEMRRNEELEYASKLTATTNQENQLLSVIVQHPKSSRESSPDMSNRPQPYCTVSDDGGANPRYADLISEPEDVEVFDPKERPKHESYIQMQPQFEQVTDLDEESETEEMRLNVSVADRVSHFLETSKNHIAAPVREDTETQSHPDGAKNVLKAAAMFETIAKNQTAPAAPGNKAPEILSRPSVFEARKGQTAPKPIHSDTFPRVKSPDQVQRRGSIQMDYQTQEHLDIYETNQFEQIQVNSNHTVLDHPKSVSPTRETPTPTKIKPEISNQEKSTCSQKDTTTPKNQPEKSPKTDPTSRTVNKHFSSSNDKKKTEPHNKYRPLEKTISASAEISSKRAFFERKAQVDAPTKQSKPYTPQKERKPLTESVQNKENIRGSSPPRKTSQTTAFIENERETSQTSPERKISRSSPERKTSKISLERKTSITSTERKSSITSPERKTSRVSPERKTSRASPESKSSRASPERKSSRASPERRPSTPAPAKERKHSIKSESPERKMSFTKSVKERRRSFTKEDITTTQTTTLQKKDSATKITMERKRSPSRESPERRAPITQRNFPDHISKALPNKEESDQKVPSSPGKDRKPSFTRESPERTHARKSSRGSPERTPKSPDRSSPIRQSEVETVELNKAGKFGVTLRRTSSTTSAGTPRRSSVPGETQEIEDVTDLSLLEIMMEKAVGYEQRRRIRAQMRIVKKDQDERTVSTKTTRKKSPNRSPSRQPAQETESKKPDRRPSSPTKGYQERVTVEQRSIRKTSKPLEPAKTPVEHSKQTPRKQDQPLTNGYHRPGSPERASPQRKESVPEVHTVRKSSKSEVEITSTVRSQKRVDALVETGVDCITSSYGVGPTDENGRPLFGLRALRRTNTNKQLTDDIGSSGTTTQVVEVREEVRTERSEEVLRDGNGRPLFGGLKALRARDVDYDTDYTDTEMPEQTSSTQLRELVQRHEKVVRETNGPQDQPRQKPRAKLRDSFILTDDEGKDQSTEGHLAEVNSLNRGLSLRSIIQKHENNAGSPGVVRSEVESSHTVVSSRTAVASDGSVSHSRNVIQGELSAKNGEEPVGKVTRTQYTYQSPKGEDQGVKKITTTTTNLGGRRTSGPRITEVEDDGRNTKRTSVTEETSGTKSVRKSSLKKTHSEDEKGDRRYSNQEDEEVTKTSVSRVSSASQKFTSSDDTRSKHSSTSTRQTDSRTNTSSPTLRRQKSSEEESAVEEKRKTVVRGDSVRALQHKFQQATENSANSSVSGARGTSARAGLILRTSSFTSTTQAQNHQGPVSSTLKQSTSLSAERKNGRQSPEKRRESPTSDTTPRRESLSKSSDTTTRRESLSKTSIDETTRRESLTTSKVSETSSFLDNTTKVTGVQDILTRMRNADLVNESDDTDADREARALLNKFLGASVILQGLEQGVRNSGGANILPDGTPGSAALVSSVEKQRVATTRQTEEDIENIWDEQVLKTLLEQCTDYDGRRKLRARLRTVMAEHKACADLVALTGDSVANSESSESRHVTTRNEGNSFTRTEVHTRTSTNRLTKASSVSSPFAKFRQLERQNSAPSVGAAPLFRVTDPRVARSASSIKDRLLSWVQAQTREYKNIQIENFSTSWNNGLAFCALIHHFCPNAFDYDQLTPDQRRHNFELAFRVAEEEADIAPLLDVEDMVVMRRPDWKCVFTYVQSVYRRFHSTPEAVRC